jgi:hypothetical protein
MSTADGIQLVAGLVVVVLGVRGLPGVRSMVRRKTIAHTWKHGALVAAALLYAIVVPSVGAVIALGAFQ